jgi:hypothetical protein
MSMKQSQTSSIFVKYRIRKINKEINIGRKACDDRKGANSGYSVYIKYKKIPENM